jgi:hypothetical protein
MLTFGQPANNDPGGAEVCSAVDCATASERLHERRSSLGRLPRRQGIAEESAAPRSPANGELASLSLPAGDPEASRRRAETYAAVPNQHRSRRRVGLPHSPIR